jgi:hypothetical protein
MRSRFLLSLVCLVPLACSSAGLPVGQDIGRDLSKLGDGASPDGSTGQGSSCTAAGGECVLGSVSCAEQAPESAQDCNPDRNPGGAFCCLSSSNEDASACTWPPSANTTDGGSGPGCVPQPEFKICEGSPTNCHDACTATEYSLTCTGSGDPDTIPNPPASLDCNAIAIPTPSNQLYYCCPCAK